MIVTRQGGSALNAASPSFTRHAPLSAPPPWWRHRLRAAIALFGRRRRPWQPHLQAGALLVVQEIAVPTPGGGCFDAGHGRGPQETAVVAVQVGGVLLLLGARCGDWRSGRRYGAVTLSNGEPRWSPRRGAHSPRILIATACARARSWLERGLGASDALPSSEIRRPLDDWPAQSGPGTTAVESARYGGPN